MKKMMNIKKNILGLRVVALTTLSIVLASCVTQSHTDEPSQGGESATVAIDTRAVNGGDLDEKVTSLRVMTFMGTADGDRVEFNILKSGITTDQTTLSLRTGTRTVVFVSNETATMTTALAAVATLADLKNINVAWTAFNATDPIPAYARYDGVVIAKGASQTAAISGGVTEFAGGIWKISLERLAVKVTSLTLTATSNLTAFDGVKFENLPSSVPLVPTQKYNTSGTAQSLTIPLSSFETPTFSGGVWTATLKTTTRIILPAKEFTTVTSAVDAVTLTAVMSSGSSPKGAVKHSGVPLDYTLHRNTDYTLAASISSSGIQVNVSYKAWTPQDVPTSLGRELNVSEYDVTLGSDNKHLIYFTSNQPTVSVDATTIKILNEVQTTEANTTISLEDFALAANFNYTYNASMGRGDGWLRIVAKSTFEANSVRKITLNAGGLKRQITITKPGYVFAMSNIVRHSDGTLYFAEDAAALTTNKTGVDLTSAQGLYFRWGSLLGLEGVTNMWNSSIVVFSPSGYGTAPTSWSAAYPPFRSEDMGVYSNSRDEFIVAYPGVGYDAATGKGDICRYISDKGWVTGRWRIPKGDEISSFMGSGSKGLVPFSAGSYGLKYPAYDSEFVVANGTNTNGTGAITYGLYLGPGVLNYVSSTITEAKIVPFPAAGGRNQTTGQIVTPSSTGYYWTSSPQSATHGYCPYLRSYGVTPGDYYNRQEANSIRCVRDL